ncbi:hypothetical protein, partial [Streptosporangium amethystogenes]
PPPSRAAVAALAESLEHIAGDVRAGRIPGEPGTCADETLERVDSTVRGLRDTMAGDHRG